MKFKKQLMAMALATVLSLSTIIAPKSVAYAADEVTQASIELDTTNPNSYQLITEGEEESDLISLTDQYTTQHEFGYLGHEDIDNTYGELYFAYAPSQIDTKSDYVTLELYKDNNGTLAMEESFEFDMTVLEFEEFDIPYIEIEKSLYKQSHLYFKVGVADVEGSTTYDDAKLFKIKNPFYNDDIAGHWAEASIRDFMSKGYVGGYSDGSFRPNNSITRAEFVTIFNKAFGLTTTSGKVFSDTKTHWAKNEIDKAVTNGVCNGKSATEFKPNDPITREEAAVMISNYKKLSDTNYDKINQYKDKGQISSWAKNSVEGMMENGFMGGYSDGTFRPKGKITRAEAVVTLSRVK